MITLVLKENMVVTPNTQDEKGKEDEVVNRIYMTWDYSKFTLSPLNRDVEQERKDRLTAILEERNLTIDQPLTVDENFVILEGQGRYLVNVELKQPIYYKFAIKMTMEDVGNLGDVDPSWKPKDRLKYWCSRDHPSYLTLKEFWKTYPWLSLADSIRLIGKGSMGGKNFKIAFNRGRFNPGNLMQGIQSAEMIKDYGQWFPTFYKSHAFIAVLRAIFKDPKYNHKRMMHKMESQHSLLTQQALSIQYFDILSGIYNKHSRVEDRHYFRPARREKK